MSAGIVIIGGGFAARQLVKNIRKTDTQVLLTVIAADSIDEYNKPDLSHVISLNQRADDLIRQSAQEFAQQYNVALFPHTRISGIDAQQHLISGEQQQWHYDKLVLATGATPGRPPVPGNELMLTLNSREDFQRHETRLRNAQRVLILGSGLIGTELAMDFCRAGKTVTLADMAASILSSLMPAELSSRLRHNLSASGVRVLTGTQLQSLKKTENDIEALFDHDCVTRADVVIAATGLKPDTSLAELAGLTVRRGIVTNSSLQTSDPDIYA
ncbi:NADH:flavorubredoxin reductase NorW, partial [Escherichia coli]